MFTTQELDAVQQDAEFIQPHQRKARIGWCPEQAILPSHPTRHLECNWTEQEQEQGQEQEQECSGLIDCYQALRLLLHLYTQRLAVQYNEAMFIMD
ncbi:hypothetical protein J6590_034220 [Homalodisca vitripennis]|nr:hypothetical protein J6590_034220 [Homalodisca vitripennis]